MADTAVGTRLLSAEAGAAVEDYVAGLSLNMVRIGSGRLDEAIGQLDALRRDHWSPVEHDFHISQRMWIAEVQHDPADYGEAVAEAEQHSWYRERFPLWGLRVTTSHDDNAEGAALVHWDTVIRPRIDNTLGLYLDVAACRVLADLPVASVAARCYESLTPWTNSWPVLSHARLDGVGHHLLGLAARAMGRLDLAVDHLRRGLALHEALGLPLSVAESHAELARTLHSRGAPGDAEAAGAHLDLAGGISRENGFRRVELLTDRMLRDG
ncbi:MAG: hypothetical protein NVSMB16_07780 [Acidimicrobiales bacterium]